MMANSANKRRYFRVDVEIPFHIASASKEQYSSFEEERILPISNINYFSEAVNNKIDSHRMDAIETLSSYLENPDLEEPINVLIDKIEFMVSNIELLTNGYNPYLKSLKFKPLLESFLAPLEITFKGNPKTAKTLHSVDTLVRKTLKIIENIGKNSNTSSLVFIDTASVKSNLMKIYYETEYLKRNDSKFSKSLLSLKEMAIISSKVLLDYLKEQSDIISPDNWERHCINLSAGGFSFNTPYEVLPTTKLTACMKIEYETIKIGSTVVSCHKNEQGEFTVRCMFDLCPSDTMDMINGFIQFIEIQEAIIYTNELEKQKIISA